MIDRIKSICIPVGRQKPCDLQHSLTQKLQWHEQAAQKAQRQRHKIANDSLHHITGGKLAAQDRQSNRYQHKTQHIDCQRSTLLPAASGQIIAVHRKGNSQQDGTNNQTDQGPIEDDLHRESALTQR